MMLRRLRGEFGRDGGLLGDDHRATMMITRSPDFGRHFLSRRRADEEGEDAAGI